MGCRFLLRYNLLCCLLLFFFLGGGRSFFFFPRCYGLSLEHIFAENGNALGLKCHPSRFRFRFGSTLEESDIETAPQRHMNLGELGGVCVEGGCIYIYMEREREREGRKRKTEADIFATIESGSLCRRHSKLAHVSFVA